MRGLFALVLFGGLVAELLGPGAARAHPIQFGVAQVSEHLDGTVDLSLRFSGSEASPAPALRLEVDGCDAVGPIREEVEDNGRRRRQRVVCDGGLVGRAVRVVGLDERAEQVAIVLRRADGSEEHHLLDAERTSLDVVASAEGWATLLRYGWLGVEHILLGFDHLLFVFVLMLLVRGVRSIVVTLTAFTVGHSVTLALSALEIVRPPLRPIEAMIAISIVLVAREAALARSESAEASASASARRRPAAVGALFGLLHGLGFAEALRQTGLPEGQITAALFGFNVGVELGQIAFVAVLLLLAWVFERYRAPFRSLAPRLAGGVAAYWCVERLAAIVVA